MTEPTWQHIAAGCAIAAAIPLLLWVVSHPVAGAATLTTGAALTVAGRRAYALTRLRECWQVTFSRAGGPGLRSHGGQRRGLLPRAVAPREDDYGPPCDEARGSTDATRLLSLREIGDVPLAVILPAVVLSSAPTMFGRQSCQTSRFGRDCFT